MSVARLLGCSLLILTGCLVPVTSNPNGPGGGGPGTAGGSGGNGGGGFGGGGGGGSFGIGGGGFGEGGGAGGGFQSFDGGCGPFPPPPTPPVETAAVVEPARAPPAISGGTLALMSDGTIVAADSDRDNVYLVNANNAVSTIALQANDEPGRVIAGPPNRAFVALRRAGRIAEIDLSTKQVVARICATSSCSPTACCCRPSARRG
jgi:hypothetical protein